MNRDIRVADLSLPCSPAILEMSHARIPELERQLVEKDALIARLRERIEQLEPEGQTTAVEGW